MGCVARILSDGETPVELIESAGWFPFRVAVVDATLFTRSEWKERHCSSSYPQPLNLCVQSEGDLRLDPLKPAASARPHGTRTAEVVVQRTFNTYG